MTLYYRLVRLTQIPGNPSTRVIAITLFFIACLSLFGCSDSSQNWPEVIELDDSEPIQIVNLSSDASYLSVVSENQLLLYESSDAYQNSTLSIDIPNITSVGYWPERELLLVGKVADNEVVFIDATTGAIADSFADCTNDSTIYDTEISPNGMILACASGSAASGYINLWEIDTHQYIGILRGHSFGMSDIEWSPDGQILASSSFGDRDILLWNVSTKELSDSPVGQLSNYPDGVTVIAFHPYEPILASGSGDESVTLWDITYHAIVYRFTGLTGGVRSLAWSSEGSMLAGGSGKGVIIIWNTNTGQQIAHIESNRGEISDIAFDDQKGTIVAVSREGYVLSWELTSSGSN